MLCDAMWCYVMLLCAAVPPTREQTSKMVKFGVSSKLASAQLEAIESTSTSIEVLLLCQGTGVIAISATYIYIYIHVYNIHTYNYTYIYVCVCVNYEQDTTRPSITDCSQEVLLDRQICCGVRSSMCQNFLAFLWPCPRLKQNMQASHQNRLPFLCCRNSFPQQPALCIDPLFFNVRTYQRSEKNCGRSSPGAVSQQLLSFLPWRFHGIDPGWDPVISSGREGLLKSIQICSGPPGFGKMLRGSRKKSAAGVSQFAPQVAIQQRSKKIDLGRTGRTYKPACSNRPPVVFQGAVWNILKLWKNMKEPEAETGSVLRGACKSYKRMTPSPRLHHTHVFEACHALPCRLHGKIWSYMKLSC